MGWDWDLCAGLLYEHRFAMLIKYGIEYGTIRNRIRNLHKIDNDLESLSDKTVKKLSLDVDIADEPTGEEGSVHQHCDHFS